MEKFQGSKIELELLQNNIPKIENDSFIFIFESENLASLIRPLFHELGQLYIEQTGYLAHWKYEVLQSNQALDLSKKEAFDELAVKFPILYQINEVFKLDFQ